MPTLYLPSTTPSGSPVSTTSSPIRDNQRIYDDVFDKQKPEEIFPRQIGPLTLEKNGSVYILCMNVSFYFLPSLPSWLPMLLYHFMGRLTSNIKSLTFTTTSLLTISFPLWYILPYSVRRTGLMPTSCMPTTQPLISSNRSNLKRFP